MWFLLLIITSYMNNRNHLPEFRDLYELLYKDEEILAAPNLASSSSVIAFAPLSNWINLNLKLNTQKYTYDSSAPHSANIQALVPIVKTFMVPDILRNHFALFIDCLVNQNFHDFGISVCLNACKQKSLKFSHIT